MRKTALFLILGTLSFLPFFSSLNAALPEYKKKQIEQMDKSLKSMELPDGGYSVFISSDNEGEGMLKAGKIINIEKVDKKYYIPNVVIIKTKDRLPVGKGSKSLPDRTLQNQLSGLNIENIRRPFESLAEGNLLSADKHGLGKVYEIRYNSPVDPYDICRELVQNPDIEYAVPSFIRYPYDYTPNDPRINNQWAINNIQMKKAWDISKGKTDVVIGIVDSGSDISHPDLSANIWTNPNEIPNNGQDDDGNGKIDDVRGWDLVGNITQNDALNGAFRQDNNPEPSSSNNFHGTHVAGCASAVTDNGEGIAGIGFKCRLLPVKCSADNGNVQGIFNGYEGILYAAELGADVINCSWGGPGNSPLEQDVINQAVDMGSVVVVASGNDGMNIDDGGQYPAGYDNVLCVGASRSNNRYASFTNYGHKTTVYAPGDGIYSTMPNGGYTSESGTSMASPVTSGVAGLLKAIKPNYTPRQIIHQLRSTSEDVLVPNNPEYRPMFYGRINAYKAMDFNRGNPQKEVPGIQMTEFLMTGKEALNDYENTYVSMEVTNYLGAADNLKMKIIVLENYLEVKTTDFNLGYVGTMESKNVDFNIELKDNNPWFFGNANLLLEFTDGEYVDYQLVQVPIRIQSSNQYTLDYVLPDWYQTQWHSAKATSVDDFWAVGQNIFGQGITFRKFGSQIGLSAIANTPVFALYPINSGTAFAGDGPSNNSANIYKTTNGGSDWSANGVATITPFINDINFFDDSEGIFLGDPRTGNWGIGKTTDGGVTWNRVNSVPDPIGDETGYVGSHYWFEDNGWFGTTKGRIFYTYNKGNSWDVSTVPMASQVYHIGFMDKNNGLASYIDSENEKRYLAASDNGGQTWKARQFDLTLNELYPVKFFSPPRSGKLYMLCSGGEIFATKDNGKHWEPVLSYQSTGANTGAAATGDGFLTRVWSAATRMSHLDFTYIPEDAVVSYEITTGNSVMFDTTDIGKNTKKTITLENTGDVVINFKEIRLVPDPDVDTSEFEFFFPPPSSIEFGRTAKIYIEFNPKEVGIRKAKVEIVPEYDPFDVRTVQLTGFGREALSVDEFARENGITIYNPYPNPAVQDASVRFYLPSPLPVTLELYDAAGNTAGTIFSGYLGEGEHNFPIETGNLSSGNYHIRLNANGTVLHRKLSITK